MAFFLLPPCSHHPVTFIISWHPLPPANSQPHISLDCLCSRPTASPSLQHHVPPSQMTNLKCWAARLPPRSPQHLFKSWKAPESSIRRNLASWSLATVPGCCAGFSPGATGLMAGCLLCRVKNLRLVSGFCVFLLGTQSLSKTGPARGGWDTLRACPLCRAGKRCPGPPGSGR